MEHLTELERVGLTLRLWWWRWLETAMRGKARCWGDTLQPPNRQLPRYALNPLPTHLHMARHKHDDAARDGGLEVHGRRGDLGLVERQRRQLGHDGLGALALGTLKRKHALILVQVGQPSAVTAKQAVVVLQEGLCEVRETRERWRSREHQAEAALSLRTAVRRPAKRHDCANANAGHQRWSERGV